MEIKWLIRPPEILRRIYSGSIWHFEDGLMRLTFDDGPSEGSEDIVKVLSKHNIKGYFFVLPDQADKHPQILRNIISNGHEVGIHANFHESYWFKSKKMVVNDLQRGKSRIESITRKEIKIARAPYGRIFPWQEKWFDEMGLQHWFWSLSSVDYYNENSHTILNRLRENSIPGDVILFHDGSAMNKNIIPVLENLCLSGISFEKP